MRKALVVDPGDLPSLPNVEGHLASAIQQGASNISTTYNYILEAGEYIFSLVTIFILVASKSILVAISILLLVLLQAAISWVQARRLENQRRILDRKRNELVARTDDILGKREILLAYEQGDKYKSKLDDISLDYATVSRNLEVKEEVFNGFSNLVTELGRIGILLLALLLITIYDRSNVSNVGDAYFLISIYFRTFVPAINLLNRFDSIKKSEATSKTFLDVLDYTEPQIPEIQYKRDESQHQQMNQDVIRFEDVSFRYPLKDNWVLRGCSFHVPLNKTTLILGRSGCGKTTIARVLLGFWPIHGGNVVIDNINLSNWNAHRLREKMSYVSQGDHIVDETVRENLSWACQETISDSTMMDTLISVGIANDLREMGVLDQPAKNLSIGQQQRLSVARMMLDMSEIVILDEPLSGVDIFTMRDLQTHLVKVLKDPRRTVVMFSHRLAFASFADHVVVLGKEGRVLEEGTPMYLLSLNSVFASLYKAALAELDLGDQLKINTQQRRRCSAILITPLGINLVYRVIRYLERTL